MKWIFVSLVVAAMGVGVIAGCASSSSRGTPVVSPMTIEQLKGLGYTPRDGVPVAPREELWIIQKNQASGMLVAEDQPGQGQLLAKDIDEAKDVPVPLKHTDVKAEILGQIATVRVSQRYQNPFDRKIEAVYVFPLPASAAVNDFLMTIGDRKIRGIVRERAEAEKIYEQAKQQGFVASLMTQERPNVFTQSVANIEPGKSIDIDIQYFHTLDYAEGWFEFVFPMVVGPRFNPKGFNYGIGAIPRGGNSGETDQKTEIEYLKPGERSGHDIAVSVSIDAGVAIKKVEARDHKISSQAKGDRVRVVTLDPADAIPNRDFVLRYKVAGEDVKSAMMVRPDAKGGGFFTLMLVPPQSMENLPRRPLEMVFTLDVSGSMSGPPIEQCREAISYALTHMNADDTFQIIRFANRSDAMSSRPLPATPENIERGLRFIASTEAGGGTMMLDGIRESLDAPGDASRSRYVAFMTDGYIGNEQEILRAVHDMRGQSRVFSFGVGSSPNRFLMDAMAAMGGGVGAYLGLDDDATAVMAAYFERISRPAMTGIAVDFGSMQASDVYPRRVPDLYVGRPVVLTGRFTGEPPTSVRLTATVGGEKREMVVPVAIDEHADRHEGLPCVWARAKIADLEERSIWDDGFNAGPAIGRVALEYGLVSAFTAFVAVDSSTRIGGAAAETVNVAVPVPEGVSYETTVSKDAGDGEHR